jgi:parallel beta-helix repeat protein
MKINQSNREDPRRIFSLHLWGVCCAVALLMLGASATLGATLNVPSQYSTIQAAINAANNGDTVQVAAGTYHEHLQVMNKTIALLGAGAQTTIVDASDSIDNRCLYLYQVGSATRVEGFTFQGARSNIIRGGGIMIGGACSPTVANNIITANSAKRGGGICIDTSCSPTLTNNTITDNSALEEGGGVWTGSYSSPVLTNNTIDGNYASQSGGGVYFSRSSATLTGNTIAHNEVAEGGKGAGFYENYGSPTLTNNTIRVHSQ